MAQQSTTSLAHFMHSPHRLTQLTTNTTYHCDGCKVAGTGARFTCTTCKFNLHECCAKCPIRWLISITNHPHQLRLFVHKPIFNQTAPCQICHNPIEGLAYQCKGCNFMVHPLCVSSRSGTSHDGVKHSSLDSKLIDLQDVVELGQLATELVNEKVTEDGDKYSFGTSNASDVYEVPSSDSSGSNTSGRDSFSFGTSNASNVYEVPSSGSNSSGADGGVFEAILRGIGHLFESSSA